MLSIHPLGAGKEDYYLGAVAAGQEDYYLGAGEAPGRWLGVGAEQFGLDGPLDGTAGADEFRALLAGQDPNNPIIQLVRPGSEARPRMPGFDLTFSAPKSVSLLYGLGDADTAAAVTAAHDRAVAEAVKHLEAHAAYTRRRVNGEVCQVAGVGLTVAAFSHRTSRAGDPQLHTHCLVPNLVESTDGHWGALDGRVIYRQAKTAGYLYQAVLRGELSRTLGVAWEPVHNGYADMTGVDRPLIDAFSKRREQISNALDEAGQTSRAAAEIAALDTRPTKQDDVAVDPVGLRDRWAAEARSVGVDPERFAGRLPRSRPPTIDEAAMGRRFVSPTGLTRRQATFDRRDITQAWCQQAPVGAEADAATIDAYTTRFLGHDDVVALAGPETGTGRWSTVEMLATEAAVIDGAASRRDDAVGIVASVDVEAVLAARPVLNDEQRSMVRALCRSGAGVDVVVGKAGSGKTTALEAAGAAWRAAGYTVAGTALAARSVGQ